MKRNRPRFALLFPLLALWAAPTWAQTAQDLDFERRGDDPSQPRGWFVSGQGYEVVLDASDVRSGKVALRMGRKGVSPGFGVATGLLPVHLARGKKVRVGGQIKVEKVEGGFAGLWMRVDGPKNTILAFDNMGARIVKGETIPDDRGVRGTADWKAYTIELDVDPAATNINFGCILTGSGTARFDALTVEIDGRPLEEVRQESIKLKPDQLAWLKVHAVPFATERPGSGLDDLQPLKAMIGDAKVVALGEATHGTAEFFRMKHRLLEFLTTEMGFTVFAIEASMPEAFRLNEYVLRGEGDPKELLKGMYFWTWNTQEVLDMILWMRDHNRKGKGRLEFVGFDMQEPKVAAENVRAFVAKFDPEYLKDLEASYDGLKTFDALRLEQDERKRREGVEGLVEKVRLVHARLKGDRARLANAVGDERAVDWAIQNARVVEQAVTTAIAPGFYRDQQMAENVDWIISQRPAGTKIVLWAHNGHVARGPGAMGAFLAEKHRDDMVVAGFAFHEGKYTAIAPGQGLKANEAAPSALGSVEHAFHQVGLERAVIDLRLAKKDHAESGWLTEPIEHRNIGAVAIGATFFPCELPSHYDLLIFFDKTKPTVLLPPHARDQN